jgi:hypothetical protein
MTAASLAGLWLLPCRNIGLGACRCDGSLAAGRGRRQLGLRTPTNPSPRPSSIQARPRGASFFAIRSRPDAGHPSRPMAVNFAKLTELLRWPRRLLKRSRRQSQPTRRLDRRTVGRHRLRGWREPHLQQSDQQHGCVSFAFHPGKGSLPFVGSSDSVSAALRSAVFSSFFRCFSSILARAALARSARSLP